MKTLKRHGLAYQR